MIILDSSACIDYLNGNEKIKKILSKQEDLIHITTITVYEINVGLERTKRKISEKRYQELNKIWTEFISSMEIFPLGYKEAERAAQIYDNLESKGRIMDDDDILIAGIMLSNGIRKILTKNVKLFKIIEGIELIPYE
ncbi:MAG: type II toxin-antitoxin system VapC family toxin [Promethearchaeota archaeon]